MAPLSLYPLYTSQIGAFAHKVCPPTKGRNLRAFVAGLGTNFGLCPNGWDLTPASLELPRAGFEMGLCPFVPIELEGWARSHLAVSLTKLISDLTRRKGCRRWTWPQRAESISCAEATRSAIGASPRPRTSHTKSCSSKGSDLGSTPVNSASALL